MLNEYVELTPSRFSLINQSKLPFYLIDWFTLDLIEPKRISWLISQQKADYSYSKASSSMDKTEGQVSSWTCQDNIDQYTFQILFIIPLNKDQFLFCLVVFNGVIWRSRGKNKNNKNLKIQVIKKLHLEEH